MPMHLYTIISVASHTKMYLPQTIPYKTVYRNLIAVSSGNTFRFDALKVLIHTEAALNVKCLDVFII